MYIISLFKFICLFIFSVIQEQKAYCPSSIQNDRIKKA